LEGSEGAKQRLEVILETIAGQLTINQACQRLGIKSPRSRRSRLTHSSSLKAFASRRSVLLALRPSGWTTSAW
jgi:hypothetical protein